MMFSVFSKTISKNSFQKNESNTPKVSCFVLLRMWIGVYSIAFGWVINYEISPLSFLDIYLLYYSLLLCLAAKETEERKIMN